MDLSCLEDDSRNDNVVTSELVARRQPFCPLLLVAMDQISVVDNSERTGTIDWEIFYVTFISRIFFFQIISKLLNSRAGICSFLKA